MPKIIFTHGISASAKTTWAEEYCLENPNTVNINRDDIRFAIFTGGVRDWSLYKFTRAKEQAVTDMQEDIISQAVGDGCDIIISDTNLNPKYEQRILAMWQLEGYEVEHKWFDVDLMTALQRDALRENGVGYKTIMRQYKQYCELKYGQDYHTHEKGLPKAIIVDIDGTVADMDGVRGPFEWDKVHLDKPRQHVIDIVTNVEWSQNAFVIFLSGRDESCREATYEWLLKYTNFPYKGCFDLIMRSAGNMEKDTIIKKRMYKDHIEGKYNIQYVIDDRPTVCRMWRYELGIDVINVGDPYQEF